jgi:single-strand DNA-binding protein
MFKVQTLGRLGRDAQIYEAANGTQFIAFTIAVNTRNQGNETTYWIDVRSFNKNHLKLAQYLKKGKIVQVGGNFNCGTATDKLGIVRVNYNIVADYIEFVNLGTGTNNTKSSNSDTTAAPNDIVNQVYDTSHDVQVRQTTNDADEDSIVMNNSVSTVEKVAVAVPVTAGATDDEELPF